ncbi:hypothetical protein GGS26DRAFT_553661 [Hypomontagnella submonticulosa]|nr:hypothetical protein GGS26DRAFT_553661 [Hypomontagnella submonticulosa]
MMREETINIEAWRRVRLGDEPIYCAAPPPDSPNDIIYVGSDEELDDDAKIARRLRYEAQGLRYLQGRPLRIMSASLRGPFDKASGWKNPWLPKPKQLPAVKKSVLEAPLFPIKPTPSVNRRLSKDSATPRTRDSVQCQLPSPQSNRELELSNNSLGTHKRRRIQAWADGVISRPSLERDAFWAPEQTLHGTNEPSRKRQGGKEWLKKGLSKRKRLNTFQDAPVASSPTPMPPTRSPVRSISVPTHDDQAMKPILSNIINNSRSFELVTPSSLTQSNPGALGEAQVEICAKSETTPSPPEFLDNFGLAADDPGVQCMSITSDGICGPSPADGQECEQGPDSETEDHSEPASEHISPKAQQPRDEEDTVLESHMDQSFQYRARPPKQTHPVTDSGAPVTDIRPRLTQTGTPEYPIHPDVVAIPVQEREIKLLKGTTVAEQRVEMEPEVKITVSEHVPDPTWRVEDNIGTPDDTNGLRISSSLNKEASEDKGMCGSGDELSKYTNVISCTAIAETGSSGGERPQAENNNSIHVDSVNSSISSIAISALRKLSELTGGQNLGARTDDPHVPIVSLEGKTSQSAILPVDYTAVNPNLTGTEPSRYEGSTLIDDPTESVDSTPSEIGGPLINQYVPEGSKNKALLTSEVHGTMQNVPEEAVQEDESDTESNLVIVPLSQLEWGVEVTEGSRKELDVTNEDKTQMPILRVEEDPDDYGPAHTIPSDSTETSPQQSPWARELSPGGYLTAENVKAEPDDDEYSVSSSHPILISSQASTHNTFIIRPSHQSPWTERNPEPVTLDQPNRYPATLAGATCVGAIFEEQQNPWVDRNTNTMSYPHNLHISPTPTRSDELLQPPLQPPSVATGLDYQPPEGLISNPTTPARMPDRPRTPDLEESIKPFALLNTPSPKCASRQSTRQRLSTIRSHGILSNGIYSSSKAKRRLSQRPSRRVSFASLPNEGDDANILSVPSATRAASPPPETIAGIEDEDVDNQYQNHFDVMRRRASGENVRFRLQPRLLPSSSQQKPMSPPMNAMAQAFREADAHVAQVQPDRIQDTVTDAEDPDQEMSDAEQSPWRKDSQAADEVAQVLENLDEYLNAWDVDAELKKVKGESIPEYYG